MSFPVRSVPNADLMRAFAELQQYANDMADLSRLGAQALEHSIHMPDIYNQTLAAMPRKELFTLITPWPTFKDMWEAA